MESMDQMEWQETLLKSEKGMVGSVPLECADCPECKERAVVVERFVGPKKGRYILCGFCGCARKLDN